MSTSRIIGYYPNDVCMYMYRSDCEQTGKFQFFPAQLTSLDGSNTMVNITTRNYRFRTVSQLYHSEFFKTQYSKIQQIQKVVDLTNSGKNWIPTYIPNSRALLTLDTQTNTRDLYKSNVSIERYMKKYRLFPTESLNDEVLITNTVNRFNFENLGTTTNEIIERDFYTSRCDDTRRYYRLVDVNGNRKSLLELQIEKSDSLVIHYINTYYDKNDLAKTERTYLNSYYCIPELAIDIAKELGYSKVTIDFGVIFDYDYKLKIPGSFKGGQTLIFL